MPPEFVPRESLRAIAWVRHGGLLQDLPSGYRSAPEHTPPSLRQKCMRVHRPCESDESLTAGEIFSPPEAGQAGQKGTRRNFGFALVLRSTTSLNYCDKGISTRMAPLRGFYETAGWVKVFASFFSYQSFCFCVCRCFARCAIHLGASIRTLVGRSVTRCIMVSDDDEEALLSEARPQGPSH
jgi:hypothetical protein